MPNAITARQLLVVIALCVAAYFAWTNGVSDAIYGGTPSPASVAAEVTRHTNEQAKLDGDGGRVRDVVCVSDGGSYFVCRGRVLDLASGEVSPISWNVTAKDGSYSAQQR